MAVVLIATSLFLVGVGLTHAATVVPTDIQQPGTQPGEVANLESADKCDNCHGGYNSAVEPAHNWRGSMMAQATRDPVFWAALAVVEQDFDGAGDLCLRCHTPEGWLGGRSTPTDGSGLAAGDADGVSCDVCHKMTNTDDSEWVGVQNPPFVANDGGTPAVGYYGSGMYSMWGGVDKLGPYSDASARHQFLQSRFHRDVDFCGTCHDVSNPAVGDLAHNNGAQVPLAPGTYSGVPGAPVTTKAAFNNFPYQYGIIERTYSEHKASLLSQMLVSDYPTLPADLKGGALDAAYQKALAAGTGGNYQDGTPRYFSCQTCHLSPVTGQGCNKNPPLRADLPLHDMTGGNYWVPDAIQYLDAQGKLRLGGGLTAEQIAALNDGKTRARGQLRLAASLSVSGNTVTIVNHTGHKLISGYPEGRRMWLNIKWYDTAAAQVREDGRYGPITVTLDGTPIQVNTLLDLNDPNTKIYEAHYAITQQWASQLLALGYASSLPLTYDRVTGAPTYTLGQLAAQAPGTYQETFHFVLNNYVAKDNRIPPYGMSYDEARVRNTLPVPASQYGNPGPGGTYSYWDAFALSPPAGAVYATIDLLYQPTSWEYIQFLHLANSRQNAFLANEGTYLSEAWLNTGMAAPYVMASATWGMPVPTMTWTATAAPTPTPTTTGTATVTPTATMVPATATATPTRTATATSTASATATPVNPPTSTSTSTATATSPDTPTQTPTSTATSTAAGTFTQTSTPSVTSTVTPVDTPTVAPSCGDGTLGPGEECDDGNLTNGDGCDANCILECPSSITTPKLILRNLDTPGGDDKLLFKGSVTLPVPFSPPLNPLENGIRLLISSTAGSVLDITIPGGAYVDPPRIGWKVNRSGTSWTYLNRSLTLLGGIFKVIVDDRSATTPGLVRFRAKGKTGAYVVAATALPVTGRIVFSPPTAQCAVASFPGPAPAPTCEFNASGSTLRCK